MSEAQQTTTQDQTTLAQVTARVDWNRSQMPLLRSVRQDFEARSPFQDCRIGVSLHIEPKTAVLLEVLKAGGAEIIATGNYGSTQDDVVAYLQSVGMTIFGGRDDTFDAHLGNVENVMEGAPNILLDNGADLIAEAAKRGVVSSITGATEETTSGGNRLRDPLKEHVDFPVIVINDSPLKAIGENKHAVGQSVVESFMRITNSLISGRRIVVMGYGWCGRGIAKYFKAFGAKVAVVEVDEIKALEACFDGYKVGSLDDFLNWGDVYVTATGQDYVIKVEDVEQMCDGAILMNAGHFPWEIDVQAIQAKATRTITVDNAVDRLDLSNGRHVHLIAEGRMINLAGNAPRGNSVASMDLGFTLQAFSLERIASEAPGLVGGAQPVPDDINRRICRMMMKAMGSSL